MGQVSILDFDYNFTLLMLIVMRMVGCVMFNPILGRRNIPALFRMGLVLVLSLMAYLSTPQQTVEITSFLMMVIEMMKQLLIGYIIGFIMQLFVSVILIAGENMDMQMGLTMAKVYDPQSNMSMAMTSSLINAMFVMIFFVSGSHLTVMKIFIKLAQMIPYQGLNFSPDMFYRVAELLPLVMVYAAKMAMPIIAAQFITEVAVGLIMRAAPQIDVFVVNVQLKIAIGLVALLILVPTFSVFLERLITLMFDNINLFFKALASSA